MQTPLEQEKLRSFKAGMTADSRGCLSLAASELLEMLEGMGFRITRLEPFDKLENAIARYIMETEELVLNHSGWSTLTSR